MYRKPGGYSPWSWKESNTTLQLNSDSNSMVYMNVVKKEWILCVLIINTIFPHFLNFISSCEDEWSLNFLWWSFHDVCQSLSCVQLLAAPWTVACQANSPGKNNKLGSHSLLPGIFLTWGLNPGLLHCRQILYCLFRHQESPFNDVCKSNHYTVHLKFLLYCISIIFQYNQKKENKEIWLA